MTNSEQLKKDRELLERFNSSVKNKYIFNPVELLAAQERIKDAEKADAVEKERERIWERLNTDFGDGEDAIVILSSDSEKPTQRPALNELKQIIYPTKNDQQ